MTPNLILVKPFDKQECLCTKTFLAASIIGILQGLKHATEMGFCPILKAFTPGMQHLPKKFFVQMKTGTKM